MKKMKYIPFDLVMIKSEAFRELEGEVFEIDEAAPNYETKEEDGEILKGHYIARRVGRKYRIGVFEKHIIPIKLTIDILKKNGWKQTKHVVDHHGYEYYLYENENEMLPEIQYYPKGDWHDEDGFSAFWGDTEIRPEISFVHELQHLLVGLDIDFDFKL